jgi:Bacteriophage tail sheath protein
MSQQLLSSKIVVVEEPPNVRPVAGASLSDTACLCITERGPFGPFLVQDPGAYKKLYGGFTPNSDGALAALQFFDNGGTNLWVSRVVHFTDASNPATKTSAAGSVLINTAVLTAQPATVHGAAGPFNLTPGDTLIGSIAGGGPLTATFAATAVAVPSTNAEPFVLTDGMTVNLNVGGIVVAAVFHTASFVSIGAALATEVDAVLNAAIAAASAGAVAGADGGHHVTLTSTQKGSGASIQILAGTANTALGFTTGTTAGTGNVASIAAATAAEVAAVSAAAFAGTVGSVASGAPVLTTTAVGPATSIQLTGGTARTKVGFDTALHSGTQAGALPTLTIFGKTDGAYANQVVVEIQPASSAGSSYFDLIVLQAGAVVEPWPNLSMNPTDPRYVETILNDSVHGSDYVQADDELAAVASPASNPATGNYTLAGGGDGLVGLVDADFLGNAAGRTGFRSLDRTPELRILIAPGHATPAVHNGMITYCEAIRFGSMFPILDPPLGMTAAQIKTYVQTTASLQESSEFGCIQWPNVKIANPQPSVFGPAPAIVVPPSAAIAGRYARNDAANPGGIYEAPAGVDFGRLVNVIGLETDEVKDENARDLVASALINPIVGLEGLPIHVDGSLTLKTTGPFPTIGERRGIIYIEQSLKGGLVFSKHRKIKPSLLAALDRSTRAFMEIQRRNDAFASDDPKKAYSIDYGGGINPPSEAFVRRVNGRIGVATGKPADFIILRVGQDTRALEEELAKSAA